ncbi:hypothetical protein AX16_008360 [Volvariella volvacea WC 439]|nr:hypothetical protein AX16_008360 [Volvariella volvacea WC 439]
MIFSSYNMPPTKRIQKIFRKYFDRFMWEQSEKKEARFSLISAGDLVEEPGSDNSCTKDGPGSSVGWYWALAWHLPKAPNPARGSHHGKGNVDPEALYFTWYKETNSGVILG